MRIVIHSALGLAIALACEAAQAQSVRSSPDAFPVPPPLMRLPVAPAPQPPQKEEVHLVPLPLQTPAQSEPSVETWVLHAGRPINVQLQEWAEKAGWHLYWRHDKAWYPPADALFKGSFDKALEEVVRSLFAEGKSVHLRLWDGNKVAEIVRSTPK